MLPLRADPAWGALVGTFLLASFLAGPIGLAVAVFVLIVIDALLMRSNIRGGGSSSPGQATDDSV